MAWELRQLRVKSLKEEVLGHGHAWYILAAAVGVEVVSDVAALLQPQGQAAVVVVALSLQRQVVAMALACRLILQLQTCQGQR
jgi:hypothetical protein